jgi:hypothetical protein
MTTAIVQDFRRHSKTRHGMRHVLLALAAYARPYGPHAQAYPGIALIAQEARLSRRQTYACLARLKREGYVAVQRCASVLGTNLYTLFRPWRTTARRAGADSAANLYPPKREKEKRPPPRAVPFPPPAPKVATGPRFWDWLGLTKGSTAYAPVEEDYYRTHPPP